MMNTVALPSEKWDLDPEINSSSCDLLNTGALLAQYFSLERSPGSCTKSPLWCSYASIVLNSVLNIVLLRKSTELSTMLSAELVTELGVSHSVALFWASQWFGVLNLATSHQLIKSLSDGRAT